jgi:hypothetical protein
VEVVRKEERAKRYNTGKVDYSLLPVAACEAECRVWMKGQETYGRDNWKKLWGADTERVVLASLLRHTFAALKGERVDTESGEYHMAHVRCNAAMLIEYYQRIEQENT